MDPGTISAIASIAGGFLGGGDDAGELSPEMQRIYQMLMKRYRDIMRESRGVPMSDPQEQAALAQAKALAGEGIGQNYQGLLASLGTDNPNAADALSNFRSGAQGTMANLDIQSLLSSLGARQDARFNKAPALLGQAMGAASSQRFGGGTDIGALLGQAASQYAFQKSYKPNPININYGGVGGGGYGGGGNANARDYGAYGGG